MAALSEWAVVIHKHKNYKNTMLKHLHNHNNPCAVNSSTFLQSNFLGTVKETFVNARRACKESSQIPFVTLQYCPIVLLLPKVKTTGGTGKVHNEISLYTLVPGQLQYDNEKV